MGKLIKNAPDLRFPEFTKVWKTKPLSYYLTRHSVPVDVQPEQMYKQIGVRSHAKGVFHKEPVTGESLGNKRVFWVHPKAFVVNIVFGWEQAIAMTSEKEAGFIASHRFPMFLPKDDRCDLDFMLLFFTRKRGKYLLELASPGGAGRNKTLGQNDFLNLDVVVPETNEQAKIASFLAILHEKRTKLKLKLDMLKQFKHGMLQKIFSCEVGFKQDDGSNFPEWHRVKISKLFDWVPTNNLSREKLTEEAGTVQNIHYGDIHTKFPSHFLQASASAPYVVKDETNFHENVFCRKGDIIIADASEDYADIGKAIEIMEVNEGTLVAGLHTYIARPKEKFAPGFAGYLFQESSVRRAIKKLAQGISVLGISKTNLEKVELPYPHPDEQEKITTLLMSIDKKIETVEKKIQKVDRFKEGLLQQMFV